MRIVFRNSNSTFVTCKVLFLYYDILTIVYHITSVVVLEYCIE